MLTWLLIIFNRHFSKRYGWDPKWFRAKDFDKDLIKRIRKFQKRNNIFPSGLCGKRTYRLALLRILREVKKRKH
jgi:murein L,D-transpeptidase YcbB/YkuD